MRRDEDRHLGAAVCAIIIGVNEEKPIRRADAAVVVAAVLVPAASGLALLLSADVREYRDNQRNWALMGGWAGIATAGVVALHGLAAFARRRWSRRIHLALAAAMGVLSAALLVVATSVS